MKAEEIKEYLFRGGIWALAGKFLTAFLSLALSALLARLLSPADLGTYFIALSIAMLFSMFGAFGIENTLLRFVSESLSVSEHKRLKLAVKKGLLTVLISSLLIATLYSCGIGQFVGIQFFNSTDLARLSGLIAIWGITLAFQLVYAEVFRGFKDIKLSVLFGVGTTAILSLLFLIAFWFIYDQIDVSNVIILCIVAGAINAVLAYGILNRKLASLDQLGSLGCSVKEIVRHSWPLLLNAVTVYIILQMDLWIIGVFKPQEDVAIYGAAMRLVMLVTAVCGVVNSIVLPLISQLYVLGRKKELEVILRKAASLAAIPALFVFVWFCFFSGFTLEIAFGSQYASGAFILQTLAFAQIAIVFIGPCMAVLTLTGQQKILLTVNTIVGVIALFFKVLIVRQYGISGIAVASAFFTIIQMLVILYIAHERCGVWTHATIKLFILTKQNQ